MEWSPGAIRVGRVICGVPSMVAQLYGHRPALVDMISAVALKTMPGESGLGSALRDERVWPSGSEFIGMPLDQAVERGLGLGFNRFALELSAEEAARRQGSPRVGERHIAVVLLQDQGDFPARMALDPARVTRQSESWNWGQRSIGPECKVRGLA